jgi:hypothetical protein
MGYRKQFRRITLVGRLTSVWLVSSLIMAVVPHRAFAFQSSDSDWAEPVNLSRSGAATAPILWTDADSSLNVLWQDAYANFVYARMVDSKWSTPQPTRLHLLFGLPASTAETDVSVATLSASPNSLYIASTGQFVVAVWLNSEGALYVSRVLARDVLDVTAWSRRELISATVGSFAAAVDGQGDVHLGYLQTADIGGSPAGVYAVQFRNHGLSRTAPTLIYASAYFRGLSQEAAHVSLASAGTASRLYLTWDNPPRKQVLMAVSTDDGTSWGQPVQVAGPAPDSGGAGPFMLRVGASGNRVIAIWQYGQPEGRCTQSYEFSEDGGATWSSPITMAETLAGCAKSNEFLTPRSGDASGLLYLLTVASSQTLLTAWNGSEWSASQPQPVLSELEDPEIYTPVALGCQQTAWVNDQLYVVGCGTGDVSDVWVTHRGLEAAAWFSPSAWSAPAPIVSDRLSVSAIELVGTDDGVLHAFVAQQDDPAIYHTRWDGVAWSRLTAVLQVPDGEAGRPVVAAGPGNALFLVTCSSKGSLYFSRAESAEAIAAAGWSPAELLANEHDGTIGEASIVLDQKGRLSIAYSVPVNDKRGIYLIQSADQGANWSAPRQVFDGAQAGFKLVGGPAIWASAQDSLHVLWQEEAIRSDGQIEPVSLQYARSDNAGESFNPAEVVVDTPVTWRTIISDGSRTVHRLWRQADTPGTLLDQLSFDGGHTWEIAQQLPVGWEATDITLDGDGRLHLAGVGSLVLEHWQWENGRWQAEEPARGPFGSQAADSLADLAAAVNSEGALVVVFSQPAATDDSAGDQLLYTARQLGPPEVKGDSQATATAELPAATEVVSTVAPSSSPEPTNVVEGTPTSAPTPPVEGPTRNPANPFMLGAVPVAVLLVLVLGIAVLRTGWSRKR